MKNPSPAQPDSGPFISTRTPLSRRHFLRGTGVALSLPFLDAMLPRFARAAEAGSPLAPGAKPRRMVAVEHNLGFVPANFFPKTAGRDYALSPYLELIKEHRKEFTVITGTSLPNVVGSHPTEVAWLTGAPHPASGSFKNTISLDQVVAQQLGTLTRFPSLTLSINGNTGLSFTGGGVAIPPEQKAANVYRQLFVQGTPEEVEAQILKLETGRSILDTVTDQSKGLKRKLSTEDRERVDQFFTSVRSLEKNLEASQGWERTAKPVVDTPAPVDPASNGLLMEKEKVMFDIIRLAFQTDSTRAITLFVSGTSTPVIESKVGVAITEQYHGLSHHGKQPDKLSQLHAIDVQHFKNLNAFLDDLKASLEGGETLLDRTQVLFGSNFHDANSHLTTNLPIILAGGGFKHGQHLVFDTLNNYPLSNLHLSMLHRLGIMEKSFSSSNGTFRGLEMT
jgi:Protein of unknown function (DUF1552)